MSVIRLAQEDDIEAMCVLLDRLFSIEQDFIPDRERQTAGLRLLLEQPDADVLVAERDGAVIGMCTLQILLSTAEGGPVGIVEDVIVAPEHRGQGVGKALLQNMLKRAQARGLTRLQLLADRHNTPALGFYQAQDWCETSLVCLRQTLR